MPFLMLAGEHQYIPENRMRACVSGVERHCAANRLLRQTAVRLDRLAPVAPTAMITHAEPGMRVGEKRIEFDRFSQEADAPRGWPRSIVSP